MGALGAHVKPGGKLRVLAVLGPKRIPEFHEIPTCLEKGYNVGDHGTYMVLITKKGTLKPVLDTLAKVFKKRADDPDVKTALIKRGICSLESGPRGNGEKSQSGIRDGP
jgi:tripartite-type tricarboxylate transporter receptor subunit TctC